MHILSLGKIFELATNMTYLYRNSIHYTTRYKVKPDNSGLSLKGTLALKRTLGQSGYLL